MKITSITLQGFKRMQLNQVASFTMTPTELIQLILGTNGSGKSSLIAELTPMPASTSDYFKDGSKTIRYSHRGHDYVLTSTFIGGPKHSFVKDGEELNDGRTGAVQKELVRQEFGITQEIHDLLRGEEVFCAMAPVRRREWFTKLCDTSYDYAISVFKKLQSKKRDIEGALKLARKRLVAEQAKVISEAEEEKLTREVRALSEELNLLQTLRAPVERPSAEYFDELDHGMRELEQLSQRLLRMRVYAPAQQPAADTEELLRSIEGFRRDAAVAQELVSAAVKEHDKVKETVQVLQRTGAAGLEALQARRAQLLQQMGQVQNRRKLQLECHNVELSVAAFHSVRQILQDLFALLPENSDRRYSQARQQELTEQVLILRDQRAREERALGELGKRNQHMETHRASGAMKCPNCLHQWHLGYSESEHSELQSLIARADEALKARTKVIEQLEAEVTAIREYGELYRNYIRTTQAYPILEPLWTYLAENNYVTHTPLTAPTVLHQYEYDLQCETETAQLGEQLQQTDNHIREAEQVGDANLAEQTLKLAELDFQIEVLTTRISQAQQSLHEYSAYRKQLLDAQELSNRVAKLREDLQHANSQRIEMLRREMLGSCIRQVQHLLVRKEETLSAVTLQKGIVADLQSNIAVLTVEEQAAEALVRELSPTNGLIAEGLLGFIHTYVAQMNSLIRRIWTYPLVVHDCSVVDGDGAELDYKFPLMAQTKDNTAPDIKQGSAGMQEIVNLAFKVVAMQYLGLGESPLYLDEFGKTFDEAHRSQAMQVIRNLMEQKSFTQLFIVSHYASSYGTLANAEICVLCPTNISVPVHTKYNQHVVMS